MESKVGSIIWDSISRLGISSGKKKCNSAKEVTLKEKRDKEEKDNWVAALQSSK